MESIAADRLPSLNYDLKRPRSAIRNVSYVPGDILNGAHLSATVMDFQPTAVVHLAARTDLDGRSAADYVSNTTGVRNIISALRSAASVRRVIFASSRYVHANDIQPKRDDDYSPFTLYGASKAEGETIVRSSGLEIPWVIIRPTSIWGPWFDVPYKNFFQAVRRGVYVHPAGERIYKSYGYVGNVVQQIRRLLELPGGSIHGRTLYAADYQPVEIRAMAETIREHFGAPPVRDAPLSVMRSFAFAGDVLKKVGWRNPPMTSFRLGNLRTQMAYDLSQTSNLVGPLPYSTEEGIKHTVEWMKQQQ